MPCPGGHDLDQIAADDHRSVADHVAPVANVPDGCGERGSGGGGGGEACGEGLTTAPQKVAEVIS